MKKFATKKSFFKILVNHNPSPYLRRFCLPKLSFSSANNLYAFDNNSFFKDDILSPIDFQSKIDLIIEKNQQLFKNVNGFFNFIFLE